MEEFKTDFLVIGSGVAGLYTAIRAATHGNVTLVTKGELLESNTWYAQGGIAAALGREDSPLAHLQDTLQAGAGLCVEDAVAVLVAEGPHRIYDLINFGTHFDRDASGELVLGKEAAHSMRRIVHARGDATGAEVAESLADFAARTANLRILRGHLALELLLTDGCCAGAILQSPTGELIHCAARGTVLATGGCGQLYMNTTNPAVATGDGLAMAARAGATLLDMEFVQFHPTALSITENPMPLVSEAVRGEGALLVNEQGERFMLAIHKWAELAPRDIVARAIFHQMQQGHRVYLDATHLGERFPVRFPNIFHLCRERGVDPRKELIPVAPAAHFMMGGVQTNTEGRTSVPHLYACGEVACTGVHGANRLASNSLLEGMVFAERVAQSLKELPDLDSQTSKAVPAAKPAIQPSAAERTETERLAQRIRSIMWEYAGIVRSGTGLKQAQAELAQIRQHPLAQTYPVANMCLVAEQIVTAALTRQESRGGHFRQDYPQEDSYWADKRVALTPDGAHVVNLTYQHAKAAQTLQSSCKK